MSQAAKPRSIRYRRLALWLAITALALPLLAPLAQAIPLAPVQGDSKAPFYMVLCKAMQEGTSDSSPMQGQQKDMSDCPVCLGLTLSKSILLTPVQQSPVCGIRRSTFSINAANETSAGRDVAYSHARAPPLSA